MKIQIAFAITIISILVLAGCSKDPQSNDPSDPSNPAFTDSTQLISDIEVDYLSVGTHIHLEQHLEYDSNARTITMTGEQEDLNDPVSGKYRYKEILYYNSHHLLERNAFFAVDPSDTLIESNNTVKFYYDAQDVLKRREIISIGTVIETIDFRKTINTDGGYTLEWEPPVDPIVAFKRIARFDKFGNCVLNINRRDATPNNMFYRDNRDSMIFDSKGEMTAQYRRDFDVENPNGTYFKRLEVTSRYPNGKEFANFARLLLRGVDQAPIAFELEESSYYSLTPLKDFFTNFDQYQYYNSPATRLRFFTKQGDVEQDFDPQVKFDSKNRLIHFSISVDQFEAATRSFTIHYYK